MFDQVWKSFSDEFFKTFQLRKLIFAVLFWACVFLMTLIRFGWNVVETWMKISASSMSVDAIHLSLLIGSVLLGIFISAKIVDILTFPMIRLAEGYWFFPFSWMRNAGIKRVNQFVNKKEMKWQQLSVLHEKGSLTIDQMERYASLDLELSNYPVDEQRRLPTRLGNILRAAEEYPFLRYGLESTIIWPRMWLVLPENVKAELGNLRDELDDRASLLVWAALFLPLSVFAWWMIPVAFIAFGLSYWILLRTAQNYGTLIRATFDLHRFLIYKSLHWPIPANPQKEREVGLSLTLFLQRGIPPTTIQWLAD